MKKIISAILAVMIIMSMCIIPAMAEEKNVALDKDVYCESEVPGAVASLEGGFWGAMLLTDGEKVAWSGASDEPIGWYGCLPLSTGGEGDITITIDLEKNYDISVVKVYPMGFLDGANMPSDYKVLVSKDETNWTEIGSETGLTGKHSIYEPFNYETKSTCRYVQIYITKTSGVADTSYYYAGIKEIEVYGVPEGEAVEEEKTFCASLDAITGKKALTVKDVYSKISVLCEVEKGGDFGLLGWILTKDGVNELQYSIAGGEWKPLSGQYRARADVHGAFPGWDEALNPLPGFGLDSEYIQIPDVKNLDYGDYEIKVRAVSKAGAATEFLTIELSVIEKVIIPDPTVFELDPDAEKYGFTGSHGPNPENFKSHETVGIKFTVPEGKIASQFVVAGSPTWGNSGGTGCDVLTKLYKWADDYDASVEADCISEVQIYGHKDNDDLIVDFGMTIEAGEYVIVFEANASNNIGMWDAEAVEEADLETFYDGSEAGYIPAAFIMVKAPKAVELHGASFDTLYVNDTMNFGEADGAASDKLDAHGRKVDGSDGSVKTIRFRGWIGFEEEIAEFGYRIGNKAPVFGDFKISAEDIVKLDENGGALASRFDITVPVEGLTGENTIVAVVKLASGTIVAIDENVKANGAGTTPNTQLTFVGPAPAVPTEAPTAAPTEAPTQAPTAAPTQAPTEDATKAPEEATSAPAENDTKTESKSNTGLIIGIIAAVVVVAVVVVIILKKKKK